MRLKQIKILGFRGFNEECVINLDADIVLVYGLNGTGKSSFTEALEWLFFEDISRRKLSACKSEYQYEEYLRNLFYSSTTNPFVEIICEIDGKIFKVRKELITEKQCKFYVDDNEVDDLKSLPVNLESYSRPMLAQTEIAALVNTEQKDRWEQLSYILGQEDLTRLRQHLIELRNSKRDKDYKGKEDELNSLLIELKKIKDLEDILNSLTISDIQKTREGIRNIVSKEGVDVSPGDYSEAIKIKMKRILGSDIAKRVVDVKTGAQEDFRKISDEVIKISDEVEGYITIILEEKVDFEKIDFFKKGKKYALIPECPFCLAKSLTKERLKDIDGTIFSANKADDHKILFNQKIQKINKEYSLLQIKNKSQEILPHSQELKIISQKLIDLDSSELAGKLQSFEKELTTFIETDLKYLHTCINSYFSSLENFYFHNNRVVVPEESKQALTKKFEEISKTITTYLSCWITLRDEIVKLFVLPATSSQREEVEKWILINKINSFLLYNEIFFKKKLLLEMIDGLQKKLEIFEKKEVEKLLTDHSEEIRDYYNRLNPSEKISFKKIEVRGGARRQARLIAEAYGKEVNPVTIFSEAHTNSLSLSIYFPQRVDRNETWNVVILDDPVQSMDQNHSSSLIEILAEIKDKKQIIVLTHSKTFAEDFVDRFDFSELLHYEFYDGGEDGPIVKVRKGKTLDYLGHVEKNHNGDQVTRESAGNVLRKAIAAVAGEILVKKGRTLSQIRSFDLRGLNKLLDQLERSGIDLEDLGKLKSLINQSHSDSHTWTIRDTAPNALLQGIKNVKEVYDKYVA